MAKEDDSVDQPALKDLTLTIVHDNEAYADQLKTAWGFAVLLTGAEKTILFDTGSDATLLLDNMAKLDADPGEIDTVVLSHVHADHTGGLLGFLAERPGVEVWLLRSFPPRFKDAVRDHGAAVVEVNEPYAVCANVRTTGVTGAFIKEQGLAVRTERGLLVLTGCAHPGVIKMVDRAADSFEGDILLVMGGFHLEWATGAKIKKIIAALQGRGVRYVAPTHCSGDKARDLFAQYFGPRYIHAGAGRIISLGDLQ